MQQENFDLYQTKESLESELAKLPNEDVQFRMWKQTTQMHKGKPVKRTTLFDEVESKEVFHKNFLDYFDIRQYEQLLILKRQLTQVEVTCQIDFAENYICSFSQEIISAYYAKVQVTIHPAVFHFKAPDGTLQYKSVVVGSDETSHKAQTVYAFIKALMGWVKGNLPQIETLHYLSNSPTCQYRNATIFGLMAHQKNFFKATWSYFVSGHGKGPCNGVGGAVKRSADTAVKKGQLIKDAKQFFEWGSEQESTPTLSFLYVDIDMVAAATTELEAMSKFSVPRTMKRPEYPLES